MLAHRLALMLMVVEDYTTFSVIGFPVAIMDLEQTVMYQATHMLLDIIFFHRRIMICIMFGFVQIFSLI